MKKLFLQNLMLLFCGCVFQVNAQGTPPKAILTGDTCAGSTLTGTFSSGGILELKWYRDTALIEARGRYESIGTTVAGGKNLTQLYDPKGIYLYKGYLYVVQGQSVQKWLPGASSGITVAGGNGKGTALNQFYSPVDVVIDGAGYLYVSDYLTSSIRKWKPGAAAGTVVAGGNGYGAGANQFSNPQSLCIDRFGNIYVTDRWNHRVQKWAPGASTGTTVAGGNGRGSAANQLYEPSGIGIDYAGNVYVSDTYNYRVQKWAPGATTGVTVAGGNGRGQNANQLSGPGEISVDSAGTVYVVDAGRRIQRWAPGATYGVTVAGGNYYPAGTPDSSKTKTFSGLYIDANKQVYTSELFKARVTKFKISSPSGSIIQNALPGTYKFAATNFSNSVFTSDPIRVTPIAPYPALVGGPNDVVKHTTIKYTVKDFLPGATYTWTVPFDATIISGQGSPVLTVKWGLNSGNIGVTASNSCGVSKTRIKYITSACSSDDVPPYPALVGGPNTVNRRSIVKYDVKNPPEGTIYSWTVPADVSIISGQNTPVLTVTWGDNSGPITVTAINGCFASKTRTKIITVADALAQANNNEPLATIYPNPTVSGASVAFTAEKAVSYELTVTNMAGRPLLKQKGRAQPGKNKADLNISNFNRGIYLVNIKYDDNSSQVLKLNKQ